MFRYTPPLRDMQFVLHELLDLEDALRPMPRYEAWDRATIAQTLEEASRFALRELLPLNASGDREGCCLDGAGVHLPSGFATAWRRYAEAGWTGLGAGGDPNAPSAV